MIAIPFELEQQVIQFAEFERLDPVTFLNNLIDEYLLKRAMQSEETVFLRGVESSLADEWLGDEDEANYRDL